MRAARQHRYLGTADAAPDHLPCVAGDARNRPTVDRRVRRFLPVFQRVGEAAQPAAQNDSDATHKNIPAMQAVMKLAMVPAATAFNPNRARSDLRVGARAPNPPT